MASGGIAAGTTVANGGMEIALSTGVTSGTTVNGGGTEAVIGGAAIGLTVFSGGEDIVASGGIAAGTSLDGGTEIVTTGGAASGTAVAFGGVEAVVGGAAVGLTVLSGSADFVASGGIAGDTTVNSGGSEVVSFGGLAAFTTLNSGGDEFVNFGGTASGTTVNHNGTEFVSSGGLATSTTVDSGGGELVLSGGTAADTTINGGTLDVLSGGSAIGLTPAVTFGSGGTLLVGDPMGLPSTSLVAGFTSLVPDKIDLTNVTFAGITTSNFTPTGTSGTLALFAGAVEVAAVSFTGSFMTTDFTLSNDGFGGTAITDPAAASPDQAVAAPLHHACPQQQRGPLRIDPRQPRINGCEIVRTPWRAPPPLPGAGVLGRPRRGAASSTRRPSAFLRGDRRRESACRRRLCLRRRDAPMTQHAFNAPARESAVHVRVKFPLAAALFPSPARGGDARAARRNGDPRRRRTLLRRSRLWRGRRTHP